MRKIQGTKKPFFKFFKKKKKIELEAVSPKMKKEKRVDFVKNDKGTLETTTDFIDAIITYWKNGQMTTLALIKNSSNQDIETYSMCTPIISEGDWFFKRVDFLKKNNEWRMTNSEPLDSDLNLMWEKAEEISIGVVIWTKN